MTKTAHRVYILILSLLVISTLLYLVYQGYSYYKISIEDRYFHPDNTLLKPSGIIGHGLGIAGSLFMILGVSL